MKGISFFVIFLAVIFVISSLAFAGETKPKYLESFEFLSGFGWGKLRVKGDHHLHPLSVSFDFNLKPLTQNINFNPPQLLKFQVEPYLSYVSSPDSNMETGVSFFLKVGILPQTSKFQPYVKAGLGLSYMTLQTREQATQFNFIDTGGIGIHYFFTKNTALTLEGRYRHLSNASIDHPNSGINTAFILAGISYQY
jgi:opacity protein-like surface antigen